MKCGSGDTVVTSSWVCFVRMSHLSLYSLLTLLLFGNVLVPLSSAPVSDIDSTRIPAPPVLPTAPIFRPNEGGAGSVPVLVASTDETGTESGAASTDDAAPAHRTLHPIVHVDARSALDFATRFDLRVRWVYAVLVLKLRDLHFPAFLLKLYTEMIRRSQNSFVERCYAAPSAVGADDSGRDGSLGSSLDKNVWHGPAGCRPKATKWDFINSFNLLLEGMRTRGFVRADSGALPVLVAPAPQQPPTSTSLLYYVFHGLHRLAAAAALNVTRVPLSLREWDVDDAVGQDNFRRWLLTTDELCCNKVKRFPW